MGMDHNININEVKGYVVNLHRWLCAKLLLLLYVCEGVTIVLHQAIDMYNNFMFLSAWVPTKKVVIIVYKLFEIYIGYSETFLNRAQSCCQVRWLLNAG